MKDAFFATRVTRYVCRFIGVILFGLLFTMPMILNWYDTFRYLDDAQWWAILITFYCCAAVVAPALYCMDRLLGNILTGKVFIHKNVSLLRWVRWCTGLVSVLCIPAAFIFLPLSFMVVIMGFLCLALTVVVQVMKAAVAIREENDLTI